MEKESLKSKIRDGFSSRYGALFAAFLVVYLPLTFIADTNFPFTFPFFQPRFIHAKEVKITEWKKVKSGDKITFVHINWSYTAPCYRAEKKELTALCDAVRDNGSAVVKNMVFLQPYAGAKRVLITQGTLSQLQGETPIAINPDRQNRFVHSEQITFQFFLAAMILSSVYLAVHIYIVVQDMRRERF